MPDAPTILCIDTSLRQCAMALVRNGETLAKRSEYLDRGHAEHIAPMMQSLCEDGRTSINQVGHVVVTIGPGGFTGIRVGLAFARGLCLGTDRRCTGIDTLKALALTWQADNPTFAGKLGVAIDAGRGEIYHALYDCDTKSPPTVLSAPQANTPQLVMETLDPDMTIIGSGTNILAGLAPNGLPGIAECTAIEPSVLAQLANLDHSEDSAMPAPLYLRAPDAKPSARSLFAHLAGSQNGA